MTRIQTQRKQDGQTVTASREYSALVVSPILTYEQEKVNFCEAKRETTLGCIEDLQEIVRKLRQAGAFLGKGWVIHIHWVGAGHTPQTILNFIGIMASEKLNPTFLTKPKIEPQRMQFCKKMDSDLVEKMNKAKPKTLKAIEDIWYENYRGVRATHYHNSRYHFLNLHSFWGGCGTMELRGSGSELHAGG